MAEYTVYSANFGPGLRFMGTRTKTQRKILGILGYRNGKKQPDNERVTEYEKNNTKSKGWV